MAFQTEWGIEGRSKAFKRQACQLHQHYTIKFCVEKKVEKKHTHTHTTSKYLLRKSFPFIHQAITNPYCTPFSPSPSLLSFQHPPPPLHPVHLRFIDFTIYLMWRWERSRLRLHHGTNMQVIYCFSKTQGRFSEPPLSFSITPIGRPWTITVRTN